MHLCTVFDGPSNILRYSSVGQRVWQKLEEYIINVPFLVCFLFCYINFLLFIKLIVYMYIYYCDCFEYRAIVSVFWSCSLKGY